MAKGTKTKDRVRTVYFIRAETLGLIKIGVTNRIDLRLASIQTFSPDRLTLMGVMICGEYGALEERLLARFHRHRSHGEWHYPAPELLAFIEANSFNQREASHEFWAHSSSEEWAAQFRGEAAAMRARRLAGNEDPEPPTLEHFQQARRQKTPKSVAKRLAPQPTKGAKQISDRPMSKGLRRYFEERGMLAPSPGPMETRE